MASKTRYLKVNIERGNFVSKFIKKSEKEYDFSDMDLLRQVFSKEKSRLLFTLKTEKPTSIYHLSKLLNRDFKAVWSDLKLLERVGFIKFEKTKKQGRTCLIPKLDITEMNLVLEI
jgi:predicted transcriptional regulator